HPIRGYAYIAAATFMWGIAATLGRAAFTGRLLPLGKALQPIDPLILSQSRTTISFLVLLPILWGRRGSANLRLPAVDFGRIVLLGVLGVAAAILAAISFAFYNVAGHQILARYDRWIVLLYTTFSAGVFWLIVNPPWKLVAAHYSGLQWEFLLVFAFVSVLAPFSFYFAGLQHLEPTRAIVASCLEPVFSIVLAALLLGESLRSIQALGIVIVLVAIVIVQLPERAGGEV